MYIAATPVRQAGRLISISYLSAQVYQRNTITCAPACQWASVAGHMTLQETYDDAMFDFSRGDFTSATAKLRSVLAQDPENYEAQLALGMALYRSGDLPAAIAEGHKAEKLRPKEQLVHTNLSLFYMKSGDKVTAEHHGLQARIAGWRAENAAAKSNDPAPAAADPELQMAKPAPPPVKVIRMPDKFPDQPWKKK